MIATRLGRSRKVPIRPDWEQIKDDVMYRALAAKFAPYADLKQLLLSTGQEEIIEKTTSNYYWGCGANGTGRNMLGKILVRLRDELENKESSTKKASRTGWL